MSQFITAFPKCLGDTFVTQVVLLQLSVEPDNHMFEMRHQDTLRHIARMSAGSGPLKYGFLSAPKVVAIDEIC